MLRVQTNEQSTEIRLGPFVRPQSTSITRETSNAEPDSKIFGTPLLIEWRELLAT